MNTLGARGFFSLGRQNWAAKPREKNFWHQQITTSLPRRRQFPLIDIRSDNGPLIIQRMEFGTETKIKLAFG